MSSEGVSVVGPRSHRFAAWFDHETAAVVTILLGLFQVLLSVLLADSNKSLPKLYILPLAMGIVIVAGGSFTMASERNPSRLLAYCWSVTLLLLLYNIGAVVMHSLLSFSALKALKTD
ncbi:uncharacterized protein si:dkey-9i23.16 isoform X3 [Acanthopagrus latus]|uniref:uncharacterized protein si:dkey-9i23.16 isoform X3 n=1 Tax=Acanthopagrus latus TaxID=8177 RepID=UPI00187C724D|nr:uncharacterized protein si:dkey-9i23.16 isoform X3 [Acanthopagrus latus]